VKLPEFKGWGKSVPEAKPESGPSHIDRSLRFFAEGAAENIPRLDPRAYADFRETIHRMASEIPERHSADLRHAAVATILKEFEGYRKEMEESLRDRQKNWQRLTATLIRELLVSLGVKPDSPMAAPLTREIDELTSAEDLRAYRALLDDFLALRNTNSNLPGISPLKVANCSTGNDTSSGLLGGGAAIEHLRKLMEQGMGGFVALIRFTCLEMVSQRFGVGAVHDCLMAFSAYLTSTLEPGDAVFQWSDSTLVAIMLDRGGEFMLTAELQRIAAKNSDIAVVIGGRPIMLRIPFFFDLTPIDQFKSADDLYRLWLQNKARV
jgi:hypothetical protein